MDKEKEILAAALKLFVEFGFHGTPTSKIAKEAGVANGTLFHYFKTKEDLIVALYVRIKADLNEYLASVLKDNDTLENKVKSIYAASLYWALGHQNQFYFIQQFHFSPHLAKVSPEDVEKQTQLHLGIFNEGMESGVFRKLPIALIAILVGNHIYGVHQYLINADLAPSEQHRMIGETFDLLWEMITNKK